MSTANKPQTSSVRQCSMSVMDTLADPNISFDANGVCNYYAEYLNAEKEYVRHGSEGEAALQSSIDEIKADRGKKKYDSILGLSGGVDSTYLCLLAKEQGLNPLVVHCDNGWNSELAQYNIEQTVKRLGFDLYTYVINWGEFRELQLSYLKASVVDIEVLTDHAFMAVLYHQARKWKIRHVLTGMNIVTENVLPRAWIYSKGDSVNIAAIQNEFGTKPFTSLKTYPVLDLKTKIYFERVLKRKNHNLLNYVPYVYDEVKERIQHELDWRDYGGKHYESVWTRFYQGYILPEKFGIDKRKAHLSNLIFSGQLTKEEALETLKQPIYPPELFEEDKEFVIKKFGLSQAQFEEIMNLPRRKHTDFATAGTVWEQYPLLKVGKPIYDLLRGQK